MNGHVNNFKLHPWALKLKNKNAFKVKNEDANNFSGQV
jgi:hypothetical protein